MATKKKASKKKVAAKSKAPKTKKLDGKALAAQRKPRDSVAQFIKDELKAGRKDVDKIIEKAKAEFPQSDPTRGYVRFVAKQIGLYDQVAPPEVEPAKPAKKKAAKKAPKADTSEKTDAPAVDPAS